VQAAFAMTPGLQHRFFDAGMLAELGTMLDIDPGAVLTSYDDPRAAGVEVLITSWGAPTIDADALARMPRLRAVVHAAGSVKHLLGPETWERGIRVTSGVALNARPVAEYALAAVLWATKGVLPLTARFGAERVSASATSSRARAWSRSTRRWCLRPSTSSTPACWPSWGTAPRSSTRLAVAWWTTTPCVRSSSPADCAPCWTSPSPSRYRPTTRCGPFPTSP
jgi:hypothetical protein